MIFWRLYILPSVFGDFERQRGEGFPTENERDGKERVGVLWGLYLGVLYLCLCVGNVRCSWFEEIRGRGRMHILLRAMTL